MSPSAACQNLILRPLHHVCATTFPKSIHYLSRGAIETAFGHLPVRPVIAAPRTIRRRLNPKIVELFPGSKLFSQPARLFSSARPAGAIAPQAALFRLIFCEPTPRQLIDEGTKAGPRTSI